MFVGIVCPNYSGSTVVGSILHRFVSVQHVGEIWKVFSPNQKEKAYCSECGSNECTYFSEDFKVCLRSLDREAVISELKSRFQSEIIVSGDKRPYYFLNYTGVPDRVLVLVKNKYSAALSCAKRMDGFSADLPTDDLALFVSQGASQYFSDLTKRINWVVNNYAQSDYVFASPDIISEADDELLGQLGERLFGRQLEIRESPFNDKFHYIGGNHKVSKGKDLAYFKGEFRSDKRYECIFNQELKVVVDDIVKKDFKTPKIDIKSKCFLEDWVLDL
jgi:hypothetical protein